MTGLPVVISGCIRKQKNSLPFDSFRLKISVKIFIVNQPLTKLPAKKTLIFLENRPDSAYLCTPFKNGFEAQTNFGRWDSNGFMKKI